MGKAGLVRLTAGRSLAEGFLIDCLAGLRRLHPAIDLELIGESRLLSLARREADLALRFGAPRDSELAARRVGTIFFGLYVASSLPSDPQAVSRLPLIGFGKESDEIAEAEWLDQHFSDRRISFRVNSQIGQAAAARAGFGIALLPRYLVADDSGLIEINAEVPVLERELWLLIRPDLVKVPRVRAVADYLIQLFARERQRFVRQSNFCERQHEEQPALGSQQPESPGLTTGQSGDAHVR